MVVMRAGRTDDISLTVGESRVKLEAAAKLVLLDAWTAVR